MSWIIGYFGNNQRVQIKSPEVSIHSYQDSNFILHSGGNKKTIFFKSDPYLSSCWSVAGVGLKPSGDGYKILDVKDWDYYLSSDKIDLREVNGHFVTIKYDANELKIFTDELGLREIYLVEFADGFGFTTRIDWLKYFIKPEIDLQEFGSRWLLYNQISRNSIIKNVKRLVCASATIRSDTLTIKENLWQPDFEAKGGKKVFDDTIKKFLCIDGKKISLSLSGGLDSRLLLSYLLRMNTELWNTHTFGDPEHPDSKIASELLSTFNLKNEIINDILPSTEKTIELLNDHAVQSMVCNPISSMMNLRFYDRVAGDNEVIIDGGFGEIWRREFANKLLLVGRKALLQKDSNRVYNLLKHNKAGIFSVEVQNEMEKGTIGQLIHLFDEMPDAAKIGPANWIDLFSIRARLANYYASEQARVDQYVISFMPLVQKDFLKLLFNLNSDYKKNGKLFKEIIELNSQKLTMFPLVKGNITHPFSFSSLNARLYCRLISRLGIHYRSDQRLELFSNAKDFILELLHSSEVRKYELYDNYKIRRMGKEFLLNKGVINSELDWFLSFELFRQGIMK